MSSASKKPKKTDQAWVGSVVKGLIILFSWMPLSLNQVFGKAIGYLLWWIPNSNKRITLINLQVAFPDLKESVRNQLAKQSLLHLGMMVAELGPAWMWPEAKLAPLIKEIKGEALLKKARDENRGLLFLAPHIGAWEMIGPYLSSKYPCTFLYRPPNVDSVEQFMVESRERFGARLAPTDMKGIRVLIKALKSNDISAILPDQDAGEKGGVHASFFGFPARTMTLASKLMQKTDCAVLFVMMERLPNAQGYRLHILPAEEAMASVDEQEATEALNRGVEACVSRLPEQYLWSYRRYRKPPAGYENPYRKQ
ncbi:MAG: lysophospholipid acyltransferase family protein [Pseudomonadota bacterium]|nr:lysophospholipid acyltransferase family protein [Pseudomonadota bacterium]